ncbi:MAG: ribose-phosphate pyrophosphokinase [Deltaproteobacteria bacterium]|nr:ribose-phosphate pyrophosphokinase [Deltaproteobacteria bacterium]
MSSLVFSTRAYSQMASEIGWLCAGERGVIETRDFPDGERGLRIVTLVGSRDVILVGGTGSDSDTLELYDLACGLVDKGVRSLTIVIPYFGHSTQERSVKQGEVVTAKTRSRLLSAIPVPGSGLRLFLLDLHADGLPYYFEGSVRAVHVRAIPVITDAIRRLTDGKPFVLACTDAGRAKWVERLANEMRTGASFVLKRREDDGSTVVTAVSAQVEGRHVVIYDDMIRTGGSLIGAAQAYKQAGATRISAVATHGIFPNDGLEKIRASGLFDRVVCTDSHPRALQLRGDFLQVEPVARLFADFLRAAP